MFRKSRTVRSFMFEVVFSSVSLVVFYELTGSQALKKLVIITATPLVATKHERQIHHI
jgi:hypothetical protein